MTCYGNYFFPFESAATRNFMERWRQMRRHSWSSSNAGVDASPCPSVKEGIRMISRHAGLRWSILAWEGMCESMLHSRRTKFSSEPVIDGSQIEQSSKHQSSDHNCSRHQCSFNNVLFYFIFVSLIKGETSLLRHLTLHHTALLGGLCPLV